MLTNAFSIYIAAFEGNVHSDDLNKATALNNFFSEVGKNIAEKFKAGSAGRGHVTHGVCSNSLFFEPVREAEVLGIIARLDRNKGPGIDGVTHVMLKECCECCSACACRHSELGHIHCSVP